MKNLSSMHEPSLYPSDCVESLNAWIDQLNLQWDAAHPNWTSDLFESLAQEGKAPAADTAPSGVPQVIFPSVTTPAETTPELTSR